MIDRLAHAAKLMAMAAISKSRRSSRVAVRLANEAAFIHSRNTSTKRTILMIVTTDAEQTKPLTADVMREVAVDDDGKPSTGDHTAEHSTLQWVRIGTLKFLIVDAMADDMARDLGAIGQSEDPANEPFRLCLRASIEVPDSQPQPQMGDTLVLQADGIPLLFTWWTSYDEANAPVPAAFLGDSDPDDWVRNPALDALQPGEALLVQAHRLINADGSVALQ